MIILMSPSVSEKRRIERQNEEPRWFASPIIETDPDTHFSRSWSHLASSMRDKARRTDALVFSVGEIEAFLSLVPTTRLNICSLFQWPYLDLLPSIKRQIYRRLLTKSKVIVTYSQAAEVYLRGMFPNKKIFWMGLFTDTDFFCPGSNGIPMRKYLLAVGDHLRFEDIIVQIATKLRMPIVRVSNDVRVASFYSANPSALVEMRRGVDFKELRKLYQNAAAVLNVVDDSKWPVGITSFCEALAMNKALITSGRHCCSGYVFDDGSRPYTTIEQPQDVDCWLEGVGGIVREESLWKSGRSPRDLAIKMCSFEQAVRKWKNVVDILGAD